jgi:ribonuclease G
MTKEIIINSTNEETRIAIREEGVLMELFVEKPDTQRMVGDIYKGKVSRVLPGMQAAFIGIGHEQNAFLHFSDVADNTNQFLLDADDDDDDEQEKPEQAPAPKNNRRNQRGRSNRSGFNPATDLKKNQDIMVQIMKEPIGTKGSRVTSQISVPGRFAVLLPNQSYIGVSRKISNFKEKRRLKAMAKNILPENFGLIVRTVAEGKSDKELVNDIKGLLKIWQNVEEKMRSVEAPSILYKDMGMASSVIRDLFTADISRVVVDSRKLWREISSYVKDVAPQLKHKIEYYRDKTPIFDKFGIEEEINKSMDDRVWMKNGAYIIIQQTEAMISIDVNSGKFIGRKDHESNSLKINLEAAREIARQARLRDIGGLIVIDFIDVLQEENKRKIYQELRREFAKDRAISKIEEMSRFGLIEMTRQRIRPSVLHSIHEDCPMCKGTGLVPSLTTLVAHMERWIQRYRAGRGDRRISIRVNEELFRYMNDGRFSRRIQLMWKYWMKIRFERDDSLGNREFKVYDRHNKNELTLK